MEIKSLNKIIPFVYSWRLNFYTLPENELTKLDQVLIFKII